MKRVVVALLLCCIPLVALAQDSAEDKALAGCKETTETFKKAMAALDADAVALTYAEDAVMGEPGMDNPLVGRDAIREYFKGMFNGVSTMELSDWVEHNTFRGTSMITVGHCMAKMTMEDGTVATLRADFNDVRMPNEKNEWLYVFDFVAMTPVEADSGE